MRKLNWLLILGFVAYACQPEEINSVQKNAPQGGFRVSSSQDVSGAREATDACGEVNETTLWAGQHIDAGTLQVYNNEGSLFVVYNTTGDWKITETHLYVGSNPPKNKSGILIPGHFPFKATHDYVTSVVYEIPLVDLDECFEVYAHAVVEKLENGEVTDSQTAFGGNTPGTGPRWFFYTDYCVQDCEDECEPIEENVWSEGELYDGEMGWATYTSYFATSNTVNLYTEQAQVAGTVTFSEPSFNPETSLGEVTITIELNDCWNFSQVSENVKIQGYQSAPSGTPALDLFDFKADASGTTFSIVLPENPYYGVHVDIVGGCCEPE